MSGNHPLKDVGLKIRNFKCFGDSGTGFETFSPINILIGKNNSGKSALIDALDVCISSGKSFDIGRHPRGGAISRFVVSQKLDEASLQAVFPRGTSGGGIRGDHGQYGEKYVGNELIREYSETLQVQSLISGPTFDDIYHGNVAQYIQKMVSATRFPFQNLNLLRIDAERNVLPEPEKSTWKLESDGRGLTDLIRAFLHEDTRPRDEVEVKLLEELNEIYRNEALFTRISCRKAQNATWEIFLTERGKGDIRLSQSGSSLKSVFIILCFIRLGTQIPAPNWNRTVLAIEEPENNLHPALVRRLLDFLAKKRSELSFTLIMASHSAVGIDWSANRDDTQIIHVKSDGICSEARTVISHWENGALLDDLGFRASDILQSNGVVWVEGPSDRIYLRRWIDLASDGRLKEGVDYSIMFYGGKLLSHLEALPEGQNSDLVSLLRINRNIAVLIDSDFRKKTAAVGCEESEKPRTTLNSTKLRIQNEVEGAGGFSWVTEGREIENYTPIEVYQRISENPDTPKHVDKFTQIVKLDLLKRFNENKVAIAHAVAAVITKDDLRGQLDLWAQLETLCALIRRWNTSEVRE